MKNAKALLLSAALIFSLFTIVTYTACKSDPCDAITCVNGGACNDGKCVCPDGFSGAFCETNDDPCANIACLNGGTCVNGACDCPAGYEGDACQTRSREKMLGSYSGTESCTIGSDTYTVTLVSGSSDVGFNLQNLYNEAITVQCTMTGKNTFTIASTNIGSGVTVTGSGKLDGSQLTIDYSLSDGTNTNTCKYIGVK